MLLSFHARTAIAVVALLLGGLLAGCGEEDPSGSPPPSSPSQSEVSSPSEPTETATQPLEPTLPSAAEPNSRSGVEAFVQFYWEVVNYATKTGDVRLLRELDQPSCEGCEGGIQGIEEVYRHGGRIVGADYEVKRVEAVRSPSGRWTAITHTKVGTQRAIGAGERNQTYPAGRDKWLIGLARIRDAWNVTTLDSL